MRLIGQKSLYSANPLVFNSPTEGFPSDDLRKILPVYVNCWQGIKWYRKIAENFNRLSMVHERYRRQTTDRQTDRRQTDGRAIANVNVKNG